MKKFTILFILIVSGISSTFYAQEGDKPNILFIAVDDLKPLLGSYGDTLAITPNIDALASKGITFSRSYCQQAVCAPSRASLMTSRYPDQTKVWDLQTLMRDMDPGIVTLPQYLIQQGYRTSGTGKIFDSRSVDKGRDKPSWSVAFRNAWDPRYYSSETGKPVYYFYASQHARDTFALLEAEAAALGVEKTAYAKARYFPAFEKANVPLDAYSDGAVANVGMELLEESALSGKPFFLAVGFSRPHLPFNAPSQFWDLYDRSDFSLAPFREKATGSPSLAYHNSDELRSGYTGIPASGELPENQQLELIHAYYAATSYIDHLIGMVLTKLDQLGLAQNTIVVLWGDHGWHLGDHQMWCKHSNFEQATRAPLIIHYPGQPNQGELCHSPVEFTDIAPTLCDLAGVNIPGYFEGESLAPLIQNPSATVREAALSQYPRSGKMGYTLRTERFRYTRWVSNDGSTYATELYDYLLDPHETVNVVFDPIHSGVVHHLDSLVSERISVPSTQTRIAFEVRGSNQSGESGPMENVKVLLAGESKATDKVGNVLFTHLNGKIAYHAEFPGFKDVDSTLNIIGDTVIILTMELKEPIYQVDLQVSDFYTGKALINTLVAIDAEEKRSDNEGMVSFHMEEGEYLLNLEKVNYPSLFDTLTVAKDTSLHYKLKATHSTLKIKLREGSTPVNGASVMVEGKEAISNALGISMFEAYSTEINYAYSINKQGYESLTGSIYLVADTTLQVQMQRLTNMEDYTSFRGIDLWPNPAHKQIHCRRAGNSSIFRIKLIDTSGRVMLDRLMKEPQETYNIENLSPGIYLVRCETEKDVQHLKLLKN